MLPLAENENGVVSGQAWWIDHFGNVQTNISPEDLAAAGLAPGRTIHVRVGVSAFEVPWVLTYGDVGEGEPLVHIDSSGLVALAVRGGRATEHFVLANGVTISMTDSEA